MKTLLKIIALFIMSVIPNGLVGQAFSYTSLVSYNSNIGPESNNNSIKKIQNLFFELGLYKGKIDGEYKSIKKTIYQYQYKKGIISGVDSWGAGYIGKKTLTALKNDFPNSFKEVADNHIKLEKPKPGERFFIVTAYYSPLPGQKKYITGNYSGDVKLNGNGKHTASGKPVFTGLLAAPKNYPFGTTIYLEGIGIGSVEDRGGAILNAGEKGHEYDRIDVWMGYGDEGLYRSMKWGKRTIKGILVDDANVNVEFGKTPIVKYSNLTVKPSSDAETIKKLQNLFKELELYSGEISGKYNDIKDSLVLFQLDNGIIQSKDEDGAGYFGKKTIAILRKKYPYEIFIDKGYHVKEQTNDILLTKSEKEKLEKVRNKILDYIGNKEGWNQTKKDSYKKTIKIKIGKMIAKDNNVKRKNQLKYLLEIL